MYSVWLTGVMATEATLSLITNVQNLTEGLDLCIATLFLMEDVTHSESNCDDQQVATINIALSVIIAMLMLILLLISVAYLR